MREAHERAWDGVRMELRDQLQHTLDTSYTLERELGGGGILLNR
jgi:hypothetical protein